MESFIVGQTIMSIYPELICSKMTSMRHFSRNPYSVPYEMSRKWWNFVQVIAISKRFLLTCIYCLVSKYQLQSENNKSDSAGVNQPGFIAFPWTMLVHICWSMISIMLVHVFSSNFILALHNISVFGFVFFDKQTWGACNKTLLIYLLLIEP